jgi:hypothetical protein
VEKERAGEMGSSERTDEERRRWHGGLDGSQVEAEEGEARGGDVSVAEGLQ